MLDRARHLGWRHAGRRGRALPGDLYPAVSPGGIYGLTVSSQTADGFVIAATPLGNPVGDACSTLGYNPLGDRSVGSGATLTVDPCG